MTIDKAGRVVIPAALRRKAGLKAGTPLAATYENGSIRIVRDVPSPQITQRGKRRVASPSKKDVANIDLAALAEEERERWPL
jgi:AbrB family looped-hinge helix DNA binding protein